MRTWEDKPAVDKTFTNIKAHFKIAWRRHRNDQKTTKMAGCHYVNVAATLVEETADAIDASSSKAVQDSQAEE